MRKEEFRKYLLDAGSKAGTAMDKVSNCNVIEKRLGCDLDSIVTDDGEIQKTLDALEALRRNKRINGSRYNKSFLNYVDFSRQGLPRPGADSETAHIRYAHDVAASEQLPGLCRFLEDEYAYLLAFAKEIFGTLPGGSLHRIPVILSKKRPRKTYRNEDPYINRKLTELEKQGVPITNRTVEKLSGFTDAVVGCFFGKDEPYIELYYTQINGSCPEAYRAKIATVLAHEYAHYLEYAHRGPCGQNAPKEECVSEALADFFGLLYSLKRSERGGQYDLPVAKDRYDLWVARFGSAWPYAYALYFYRVNGRTHRYCARVDGYKSNGCVAKLNKVFRQTPDPQQALRTLQDDR